MKSFLFSLLIFLNLSFVYSQCNVQVSICQSGIAGPFNFIPSGGAYVGKYNCHEGVYVYKIRWVDAKDIAHIKHGHIKLLR